MSTNVIAKRPFGTGAEDHSVHKRRRRIDYPGLALWISLVVTSLLWALPFFVMFVPSVKTNADINRTITEGYESRQRSQDRNVENFTDYIRGVQRYQDPTKFIFPSEQELAAYRAAAISGAPRPGERVSARKAD